MTKETWRGRKPIDTKTDISNSQLMGTYFNGRFKFIAERSEKKWKKNKTKQRASDTFTVPNIRNILRCWIWFWFGCFLSASSLATIRVHGIYVTCLCAGAVCHFVFSSFHFACNFISFTSAPFFRSSTAWFRFSNFIFACPFDIFFR